MITQKSIHPNAFIHRPRCHRPFLLYTWTIPLQHTPEKSPKVAQLTNPRRNLNKGRGKQKRRKKDVYRGREGENRELPPSSNSRYVGEGETFIPLVRVVSNARVVEPGNEQDRAENREEHPCTTSRSNATNESSREE
ncbi:hypothetical protein EUGRSUZ_C00075 [Eucalyptus grandis]|uniref:Uncharacterized protein n=2 Tax=Eucalyptus grandis TaxID=71139 RepID=A0ACC3L8M3_EUCGR|nr:hypothetical protein EUGRSUZ_C00075 [Eucalyptus grandis]